LSLYHVQYHPRAKREIDALPKAIGDRIVVAIDGLVDNPRPRTARKIVGRENVYRIRVGRYQVIYEVNDDQRIVFITRVRIRTETTYRGL